MKIIILGSGLMGPMAAFNAIEDPDVTAVTLADVSQDQLDAAVRKLGPFDPDQKLQTVRVDLSDRADAADLLRGHNVVLSALSHAAIPLGIRAAVAAKRPLVDLSWPDRVKEVPALQKEIAETGILVIPGCGLEPGLTEIWTRHLADQLDRVEAVHIKCGGIPERPTPPLGYKIVFGGRRLPLREFDAAVVREGELRPIARYSEAEMLTFDGIGEVEAWHEGFMPWLLELDALKGLRTGTQKTIRWPGYAQKVTVIKELGLLSHDPIEIDGVKIAPKHFLDTLLYPKVRMDEGERDITLFRVDVEGIKNGEPRRLRVDMVDRHDDRLGFTSMARTTATTGAIVARMVARGEISGSGWQTPEKLITGVHFERLIDELARIDVRFVER
ncbi:MAG: saccharopine dehydrogenase NADP-binding domain-containing protein [Caldilineaceae bacterium]|nr:saccharopine dehydrogenase NADP-binding domain-containing protein [Caldilineaceae bacterium]